MISQIQKPASDSTQHSQETNINALAGIQTRIPSKRVVADPRLRPRGHWDRHILINTETIFMSVNSNKDDNNINHKNKQNETTATTTILKIDYFFFPCIFFNTRVGTLIVATIYLQLIQNKYMFRSFTVLQCSHQHCVQPFASDVEVVGFL